MNIDNNWVKYLVSAKTRQGEYGELTLPSDSNVFCFAYGTDEMEAGRKVVDWWFREYPQKTEHWRTGAFSDDLIYTYIYQKNKRRDDGISEFYWSKNDH